MNLFTTSIFSICIVLLILSRHTLPEEEEAAVGAPGKFLSSRLHSRFHVLRERLRTLASRRRRLGEDRERRAEHDREEKHQRELDEHVVWNASARSWEHESEHGHSMVASQGASDNAASGGSAASSPLATSDPISDPLAASGSTSNAGGWSAARLRHVPVHASALVLPSPPPPLGPPVLLRYGSEASCLHFQEPLEALARAVCDFDVAEQRFVFESGSRTLRCAGDS